MSAEHLNRELIQLACEVLNTARGVADGKIDPTDSDLHRMLEVKYIWLCSHTDTNEPLPDAIEMCLIDLLSCEGASWDTPMWSIVENLGNLERVLDSIKGED